MTLDAKLTERLEAAADALSDVDGVVGGLADELEAAIGRISAARTATALETLRAELAGEVEAAQNGLDSALITLRESAAALDRSIRRSTEDLED
jgi:hypothetical protein